MHLQINQKKGNTREQLFDLHNIRGTLFTYLLEIN